MQQGRESRENGNEHAGVTYDEYPDFRLPVFQGARWRWVSRKPLEDSQRQWGRFAVEHVDQVAPHKELDEVITVVHPVVTVTASDVARQLVGLADQSRKLIGAFSGLECVEISIYCELRGVIQLPKAQLLQVNKVEHGITSLIYRFNSQSTGVLA